MAGLSAMAQIGLVFVGGGAGSVLRFVLHMGLESLRGPIDPARFPVGTLTANVIGCGLIGLLAHWLSEREAFRILIAIGLLGGFTTFSSFGLETIRLVSYGQSGKALLYVLLTNAIGLIACGVVFQREAQGT